MKKLIITIAFLLIAATASAADYEMTYGGQYVVVRSEFTLRPVYIGELTLFLSGVAIGPFPWVYNNHCGLYQGNDSLSFVVAGEQLIMISPLVFIATEIRH